jgi:hypothetical protein
LIIKPVNSAELVDKIIIKLNGNNKWKRLYKCL